MAKGRLTVLGETDPHTTSGGGVKRRVLCACQCGEKTVVRLAEFLSGRSASCGCLKREATSARFSKAVDGLRSKDHPLYPTWKGMKERCYNPKNWSYKYYGAKGVSVCPEWLNNFPQFVLDVGPKPSPGHSLDRVDSSLNYSPDNCRWATQTEQTNNQSSNRRVTIGGESLTVAAACRLLGHDAGLARSRINRGWSVEDAVLTPRLERGRMRPVSAPLGTPDPGLPSSPG